MDFIEIRCFFSRLPFIISCIRVIYNRSMMIFNPFAVVETVCIHFAANFIGYYVKAYSMAFK